MKRFLFITSTNLASNPRLLKELRLALAKGYKASVLQFRVGNWSDDITALLKNEFPEVEFIELSALRKPYFPWLLSTILQKISSYIPLHLMNTWMLSVNTGKRTWLILQQLKKIQTNYDWVIAHNPAAFYPALVVAKKNNCALGIDIEDYHPGETNDKKAGIVMKKLMQRVLPFADYCSYAAPLIAEEIQKDIPEMNNRQITVLNGFDGAEFSEPIDYGATSLQLVWFSQNIDAGRGLEQLIPVVNELYPAVELHLIGNLKKEFDQHFLQDKTGICIHEPMQQKELHQFLARCDVGMATDIPVNRNRDIALTNKMIAYAQAGLFIIALNTEGQRHFLLNSNLEYKVIKNTKDQISKLLCDLNRVQIKKNKGERFKKGRVYDWDRLNKPLLEVWGGGL